MNPLVLHFLNLAQRAGNTPTGQAFLRMAQNAANRVINAETKFPTLPRGPAGQFPARPFFGDKLPVAPISRGAAGLAGAAGVGMGSGQFEGVRDHVMGSSEPASSPNPLFSQLDRSASAPTNFQNSDMSAAFLDGPATPRFQNSDMSAGFADPPQFTNTDMSARFLDGPSAARAAVRTAHNVMPQDPPLPPPRARDEAPARGRFFSGPDYQSMNALAEGPERGYGAPVLQNGRINWGDSENPADFVRADAAMRARRAEGGGLDPMGGLMPPDMATMPVDAPEMPMPPMPADAAPPPSMDGPKAPAAGGGAGGRDAAINKALDIIHNLVTRQRI